MNENIGTNRELDLRFLDLAFSMKMSAAVAMLTADATWWVIGDPSRIKVAGLRDDKKTVRMLMGLHKLLPHGMQRSIMATTAEDVRVAVQVEAEGTGTTDNHIEILTTSCCGSRDGQIATFREYMDPMQLL